MEALDHQIEIERSKNHVSHDVFHPNGSQTHQKWAQEQTLHVAVAYSNPRRWATRQKLFNDFRRHIAALPNIKLYVGELAYGNRPFEVTSANHPTDFQFRTKHELWHKENILNCVISRFPADWKYGAYIDGDFNFTRVDIGLETIHQLQHYDWVQMYSTYCDLSPGHQPMRILKSFAFRYKAGDFTNEMYKKISNDGYYSKPGIGIGTTGGAWAFRRESFNSVGGLLDVCVLGSGDWHMAFGLIGEPDVHPQTNELVRCGSVYADFIKAWQNRASAATRKNIGVVDCHAIHYFHGSKAQRGYGTRWKILRDADYNPVVDIHKDWQGIYQLTPDKIDLRDNIRKYFESRNEDNISLLDGDVLLGN